MKVIIGTRGSALAQWQARHVADLLKSRDPSIHTELQIIRTTGDKVLDVPLAKIGGKGLFTKEIEEALLDGSIHIAVHSMKDLPTELPPGLRLGAILKREDPRDAFVSRDGAMLSELGPTARIGTSSLRRRAFLLNRHPHLDIVPIRGNVDTRLRKVQSENLAGVILACAGMQRMGFASHITTCLDPEEMIPAIGQGALGIELPEKDGELAPLITELNHPETAACVLVERAFLLRMGGGCQVPLAAHAVWSDGSVHTRTAVVHPEGSPLMAAQESSHSSDIAVGSRLADVLIQRGADRVMREINGPDWEPGALSCDTHGLCPGEVGTDRPHD